MTTTTLTAAIRNIHLADQVKPALCVPSDKDVRCVISETTGIHAITITLDDFVKAEPVLYKGQPYPLSRFADQLVAQTRKEGALQRTITRSAARLIAPFVTDSTWQPVESRRTSSSTATPRGNLVATLCAELGLEPKKARRILRKAGMNAPYTDESALRAALTSKPATPKTKPAAPSTDADATPKATKKAKTPAAAPKAKKAAAKKPSKARRVPVTPELEAAAQAAVAAHAANSSGASA